MATGFICEGLGGQDSRGVQEHCAPLVRNWPLVITSKILYMRGTATLYDCALKFPDKQLETYMED